MQIHRSRFDADGWQTLPVVEVHDVRLTAPDGGPRSDDDLLVEVCERFEAGDGGSRGRVRVDLVCIPGQPGSSRVLTP